MVDTIDIDTFVTEYENHERNIVDLEDIRFGEIYLNDREEKFYD